MLMLKEVAPTDDIPIRAADRLIDLLREVVPPGSSLHLRAVLLGEDGIPAWPPAKPDNCVEVDIYLTPRRSGEADNTAGTLGHSASLPETRRA